MKTKRLLLLMLGIFLFYATECKEKNENFIFRYSMESVTNYKTAITINSDRTYTMEEYNYFFDNASKERKPLIIQGTLNKREFEKIKTIIHKSNIFHLKDTYGFNESDSRAGSILYQVSLKYPPKEKFISLRDISTSELPTPFKKLIKQMNELISKIKTNPKEM